MTGSMSGIALAATGPAPRTPNLDAAAAKATAPGGLSVSVWTRLLETSTREVFETMLGEPAAPAIYGTEESSQPDIIALVGLSGALEGSLRFRCHAAAAYQMGARMAGMSLDTYDELVFDAIGEIANMLAGCFKSKIPGLADACHLSVPTVLHGSDFTLDTTARGEVLESCFLFHGSPFWVSLDLWPESV